MPAPHLPAYHFSISITDGFALGHIEVICVQEHRFYHLDIKLDIMILEKAGLLSQHPHGRILSIGGVGMLLSPTALRALNRIVCRNVLYTTRGT